MTSITVVLLLVACTAHGKVITVNNAGVDSAECCGFSLCLCSSLSQALHHLTDNTIINITSESVVLDRFTKMGSSFLNNITITGNDIIIRCNNVGAIYCASCSDITIEGITFDQCGRFFNSSQWYRAINFYSISNISIARCSFQNSLICAVGLYNASKNVGIVACNFLSDFPNLLINTCTRLLVYYGSYDLNVTISRTNFINSGHMDSSRHRGVLIANRGNDPSVNLNVVVQNTSIFSTTKGLIISSYACSATIYMSNLRIYNNSDEGIYVNLTGCGNNSQVPSLHISASTFVSNANALVLVATSGLPLAVIQVNDSIFENNLLIRRPGSVIHAEGALSVTSMISSSVITVTNCNFMNNFDGAVGVRITPPVLQSTCNMQTVTFSDVLVYNTTTHETYNGTYGSVSIVTADSAYVFNFERVNFVSNNFFRQTGGVLFLTVYRTCNRNFILNKITLANCALVDNNATNDLATLNIITNQDNLAIITYFINIVNCSVDGNVGGDSIFHVDATTVYPSYVNISESNFTNNIGSVFYYLSNFYVYFNEIVYFTNNTANTGAAIDFELAPRGIQVYGASMIYFINNSVRLRGGAIYMNVPDNCIFNGNYFTALPNDSYVTFVNNSANLAGNSIYFNIPQSCNVITNDSDNASLLYVPNMFNYYQIVHTGSYPVITSPHTIKLHLPEIAPYSTNESSNAIQSLNMLGELITFSASVFDYFNHSAEPTIFHMRCDTCGSDYVLSKDQISVASNSVQEFQVFPKTINDVVNNYNINITFMSILLPTYKQLTATLVVKLSPCRSGYLFDSSYVPPQCVCYPRSDIIQCTRDYSEIRIGYWVGNVSLHYTSSLCPNDYCNFAKREETSPGYFELPNESDEQCSSHRTGVACGECISGYTLAYDSPICINNDKCSAGITVLVVLLTIIYWIVVVAVVFGVMYFNNQVLSGYVYGIIYFYSIVDILLGNNLYISEGAFQAISILSSFAKLTPEVLGKLCFVKGLSGIDQHFIHYSHAVAVSIITLTVVIAARYSLRIARYISRCIIRVICILILLSYTSLASTSLQLLRPLTFNDIDDVRTFLSPEIKYFTNRHLVYAIVALLCEALLIGLLVLLLFEPLIRKKITLIRIKPLLDQFQGCFKDKYHWFAAYYLICRQVIILIVYVGNTNYYNMLFYLQTACIIIAMIHIWIQPYKNDLHNALDSIVLLTLVLVINVNTFTFLSSATVEIAIALVFIPLILCLLIAIKILATKWFVKRKLFYHYSINQHVELGDNDLRKYVMMKYMHIYILIPGTSAVDHPNKRILLKIYNIFVQISLKKIDIVPKFSVVFIVIFNNSCFNVQNIQKLVIVTEPLQL